MVESFAAPAHVRVNRPDIALRLGTRASMEFADAAKAQPAGHPMRRDERGTSHGVHKQMSGNQMKAGLPAICAQGKSTAKLSIM